MRICTSCRRTFDEDLAFCPYDGLPLIERSLTFSSLNEEGDAAEDRGPDAKLAPGMMVGEYQVERLLAEGGMGVVYAGVHPIIRKRVAIKVLNRSYAADPKAVSRFVLEARSVNEIGHHNIVDIFNIGELDDGRNYLIMELLEGLTLYDILQREQRLLPGVVVPIFEQLCDALAGAHDKGFVHRDLKPDNVVVLRRPPYPFIKILDFGLAKLRGAATDHQTKVGTIMGTPEYMSPEQCRGGEVDERTDIYSLGVLLYELVTGQRPFTHVSPLKVLVMQQKEPVVPPSTYVPISSELEVVIVKALAKDPGARFASATEFVEQLKRAVPVTLPWTPKLEARARGTSDHGAPAPLKEMRTEVEGTMESMLTEPIPAQVVRTLAPPGEPPAPGPADADTDRNPAAASPQPDGGVDSLDAADDSILHGSPLFEQQTRPWTSPLRELGPGVGVAAAPDPATQADKIKTDPDQPPPDDGTAPVQALSSTEFIVDRPPPLEGGPTPPDPEPRGSLLAGQAPATAPEALRQPLLQTEDPPAAADADRADPALATTIPIDRASIDEMIRDVLVPQSAPGNAREASDPGVTFEPSGPASELSRPLAVEQTASDAIPLRHFERPEPTFIAPPRDRSGPGKRWLLWAAIVTLLAGAGAIMWIYQPWR